MFTILAQPFGWILQALYGVVGKYWLAILIFSIVVRIALYPVHKKTILNSVGMAEMGKKQQEIQKKYANDREMMNKKLQDLYAAEGYNPASGCLPMLIQVIVISGLFILLRNPMQYYTDEKMVFAIHESFLWIKDLCQPDPWILPIATGVATFFAMNMSGSAESMAGNASNNMGMNMMKYLMPIMLMWLAHSYPAALAIYWTIGQIILIFFNLRFKKLREEIAAGKVSATKKKKVKTEN